jgi:DnaJ-class molecular chaperone
MPKPIVHTFYNTLPDGSYSEEEVEIPTVWQICDTCRGEGKSSAYLGVISPEDEADDDWMEDYTHGRFDKPCNVCKGLGRVAVPDEQWLDANPDIRDRYEQDMDEEAAYEAECRAERRYLGLC